MICNNQTFDKILGYTEDEVNVYKDYLYEVKFKRQQPPTENQIKNLKRFLKDFQIKVHIPEFNTVAEMESWKKQQTKNKLGC